MLITHCYINEAHWRNGQETLRNINKYGRVWVQEGQKVCLICDAFKAHSMETVKLNLEHVTIKVVSVPKNMTHLLQPLDLTTNLTVKKMKQEKFSSYFTACITEVFQNDPNRNVATVKVDLKLCNLKPCHANLIVVLYNILKTHKERRSFWTTGSCRSSSPEVFLGKSVLKICSKFTGGYPCRGVISIQLLCNFMEITLRHGCSPVNLLHIFRTTFPKNTSGGLLLKLLELPKLFYSRALLANESLTTYQSFFLLYVVYIRKITQPDEFIL